MAIPYEEAMKNLQSMFQTIEREVIHQVLVKNKGKVDPTIEDLLSLADDSHPEENENLFQETESTQLSQPSTMDSNLPGSNKNQQEQKEALESEELIRNLQEQDDLDYALKLQETYMKEHGQEQGSEEDDQYQDGEEEDQQSQQQQPNNSQAQQKQPDQKPPKKTFKTKLAAATKGITSLFSKKKKAKPEQRPSQNQPQQQQQPPQQKQPEKKTQPVAVQKAPQKKQYTYEQIEKMFDREIICFDNPIGGGSFYNFSENADEKSTNLNLNEVAESMHINKQKQNEDHYYSKKQAEYYRPHDEEEMSHYFRIDERGRGEEEPKSDSNRFGNSRSHQYNNRDQYDSDRKFDSSDSNIDHICSKIIQCN